MCIRDSFRHVSQFKGFILEMAGNMMREDLNRQKREESFKNKVIDFIRESYADKMCIRDRIS